MSFDFDLMIPFLLGFMFDGIMCMLEVGVTRNFFKLIKRNQRHFRMHFRSFILQRIY